MAVVKSSQLYYSNVRPSFYRTKSFTNRLTYTLGLHSASGKWVSYFLMQRPWLQIHSVQMHTHMPNTPCIIDHTCCLYIIQIKQP